MTGFFSGWSWTHWLAVIVGLIGLLVFFWSFIAPDRRLELKSTEKEVINNLKPACFKNSKDSSPVTELACPKSDETFNDLTTFLCGHSCCLKDANVLTNCPICNIKENVDSLDIEKVTLDEDDSEDSLMSKLDCPKCHTTFNDPTTFLCGHSCCLKEAKQMMNCPVCNDKLVEPERMSISFSLRDMVASISDDKSSNSVVTSAVSKTDSSIQSMECPICFVNYKNPTTFPCGHSCCMSDVPEMKNICHMCGQNIPSASNLTVSTVMQDIIEHFNSIDIENENLDEERDIVDHVDSLGIEKVTLEEDDESEDSSDEETGESTANVAKSNSKKKGKGKKSKGKKKRGAKRPPTVSMYIPLGDDSNETADEASDNCSKRKLKNKEKKKSINLPFTSQQIKHGQLSEDEIAAIFYDFKFNRNQSKLQKLEELVAAGNLFAEAFYMVHQSNLKDNIPKVRVSLTKVGPWLLKVINSNKELYFSNKYYTFLLGMMYMISGAPFLGLRYLQLSASLGYVVGQFYAGMSHFEVGDSAKAIKWLKVADEQSHLASAQFELGDYYEGINDARKAFQYFKASADQGHDFSQYRLAFCYSDGAGVTQNKREAFRYWKLSADQGNVESQFCVGSCYTNGEGVVMNLSEAHRYTKLAADNGNSKAQCHVGLDFKLGKGVPIDFRSAFTYFKKSADQNNARAQQEVSYCYGVGQGVVQNPSLAFSYGKKAADQGIAEAQHNTALCYKSGHGGAPRNDKEAVRYWKMSADGGYPLAQYWLGNMYFLGSGTKANPLEGFKYTKMSADNGNAEAQFNVGRIYYGGMGDAFMNVPEAIKYLKMAKAQGNQSAIDFLKMISPMEVVNKKNK